MKELPIRRVLLVLIVYGIGALLLLPVVDALARVIALPPLFGRLIRGALVVGVPLAAAVAWRYDELGTGDGPEPPELKSGGSSDQ